jgi:hypothetical protein
MPFYCHIFQSFLDDKSFKIRLLSTTITYKAYSVTVMLLNRWNSDSGLSWMLFFVTLGMNSRMISSNFSYGCRPVMDVLFRCL